MLEFKRKNKEISHKNILTSPQKAKISKNKQTFFKDEDYTRFISINQDNRAKEEV